MNAPVKPVPGMSMIVRTVTRWLKGPILLFGIYIVLYGHVTPGGGFGGGVIIASAFILIMLALGGQHGLGVFSKGVASRLDSAGLLAFLIIGWLGTFWASGYFFANFADTPDDAWFTLFSGGTMPWMNVALGLKVASALFLVFAVLTGLRIGIGGDEIGEEKDFAAEAGPVGAASAANDFGVKKRNSGEIKTFAAKAAPTKEGES
jgi:multicomponent Na+:H+ antiporter subunit B